MVKYERLQEMLGLAADDRPWTYSDLLKLSQWKNKRNDVLRRDSRICTTCGLEGTIIEKYSSHPDFSYIAVDVNDGYIPNSPAYELTIDDFNRMRVIYIPAPTVILHVHHRYYLLDSLPWEYNDAVLITMCSGCHHKWHAENKAVVYQKRGEQYYTLNVTPCDRCHGVGSLHQYKYYMGGICFKCNGARYNELIEYCRPPRI